MNIVSVSLVVVVVILFLILTRRRERERSFSISPFSTIRILTKADDIFFWDEAMRSHIRIRWHATE